MKKIYAIAAAALLAAPVQAADWNGFYMGTQIGYGSADVVGIPANFDGSVSGVHVGYNRDFGKMVVGGELDYNFGAINVAPGVGFDQLAHFKVKAGYDGGRWLAYGTAGAAYTNLAVGANGLDGFGYVVGAGVDYQVTDHLTIGGEYNFNSFDSLGGEPAASSDIHTFQARMSFHF
ncbi:outer membrane protein [Halovulum sp. GXIMD14793]